MITAEKIILKKMNVFQTETIFFFRDLRE